MAKKIPPYVQGILDLLNASSESRTHSILDKNEMLLTAQTLIDDGDFFEFYIDWDDSEEQFIIKNRDLSDL